MSDEDEITSDDVRPASIIHDNSIHAEGGSSISSVKNFVRSNRELLLGVALAVNIVLGAFLLYGWRERQVSEDLKTFNFQQAQIQMEVDKQLLMILNCKR